MPETVVTDGPPRLEYISEDDLNTYEGWLNTKPSTCPLSVTKKRLRCASFLMRRSAVA